MFAHHRGKYSKVKLCYNKIFKGFLKYVISALKKKQTQKSKPQVYLSMPVIFMISNLYHISDILLNDLAYLTSMVSRY